MNDQDVETSFEPEYEAAKDEATLLLDAYQGRATMLSRAIMMGITAPDVVINGDVMLSVVTTLADELLATDREDMRFEARARRVLNWAMRPDVQPEYAILMFINIAPFLQGICQEEVNAFLIKYRELFPAHADDPDPEPVVA